MSRHITWKFVHLFLFISRYSAFHWPTDWLEGKASRHWGSSSAVQCGRTWHAHNFASSLDPPNKPLARSRSWHQLTATVQDSRLRSRELTSRFRDLWEGRYFKNQGWRLWDARPRRRLGVYRLTIKSCICKCDHDHSCLDDSRNSYCMHVFLFFFKYH